MTIRIGISGWIYPPWRGPFYPDGLAQKRELDYASRHVTSIEINGTFYSLKRPEHFRTWAGATPAPFVFALKGGQYVTHILRLKDFDHGLVNYMASGVLALGSKLGPILWQFPPNMALKDDRFEKFADALPFTTEEAVEVAKRHTSKVAAYAYLEAPVSQPMRHAFELRHPSFANKDFLAFLRDRNIAAVFADAGDDDWPEFVDPTADFIYFRNHGTKPEFKDDGYTDAAIERFAARIRAYAAGGVPANVDPMLPPPPSVPRDVYVYFDNDAKAHAPRDAQRLMRALGIGPFEEWKEAIKAKTKPRSTLRSKKVKPRSARSAKKQRRKPKNRTKKKAKRK